MKRKQIVAGALCIFFLSGCSSSSLVFNDTNNSSTNSADIADSIGNLDSSNEADTNATDSNDDSDSNADIPWNSPMAECIPNSPYPSYISFVKGEISTYEDNMFLSDYITGDYKYTCCDLSGDGVAELVLLYSAEGEERIQAFGYDSETDEIYNALNDIYNPETDYISKNGFVLLHLYKDIDGEYLPGKTDDESCTQLIEVEMAKRTKENHINTFLEWVREPGSSEYTEGFCTASGWDYDYILEMAQDEVEFTEGKNPEDMIPYLEECDETYEIELEEYRLYKQQGNGLFYNTNILDVPDNKYQDAESAYEAFLNNETCARCEQGIGALDSYFTYIYGDKYILSDWYEQEECDDLETTYIDCGSDGTKELLVEIMQGELDYMYVISFYEGHLYLRFVTMSWARSQKGIGEDGYIICGGGSSAYESYEGEAVLDSNVIFRKIYDKDLISYERIRDSFPKEYEISVEVDFSELYVYEIDHQKYYVAYLGDDNLVEKEDYTDFMNACAEYGITFSSQEEVDELIKAKKAEYGF